MVFKSYTVREGLSHNFVRKTIQDSTGFIWIATIDGLNKFDGYSFKTYKTKPNDSTSLSSDNIMTFAEDKNGNLWVGTWGGGICIYNRKLDNFKRIPRVEGKHDRTGITSNFISDLYEDSKGRIWISTFDEGLILADPEKLTFTHYRHNSNDPASLSHNEIASVTEDENGKLWIATHGGGINHFDPETGKFTRYLHEEGNPKSLSHNGVNFIFYDSKKRLWVGTSGIVLDLMENRTGEFIHFRHQPDDPNSINNSHLTSITETRDGKIWIGTDAGMLLYNENDNNFTHYKSKPFDPKSVSSNQIKSIYEDNKGSLWVGTYNGGVNLFDKSFVKILHYYTTPDKTSLSFNDVSAFLQAKEGSILVGTDGGGLNLFDKKTGTFTHFKHDPEDPNSIGSNLIKSVLMDRKGRIWIGLWGAGLDQFDPKKQIFTHFKKKEWGKNWLGNANVTCLAEDEDGFIWASTWGNGIYKFNPDHTSFEHFTHEENDPYSLSDKHAWAILADHENNIWVGNSNGILDLLDRKSGRFVHIDTKQPGESGSVVLGISEDSDDRLWLGMEGGGLKLLNRKSLTFTTYKMEDGLPSNYINAIEEDQYGNLWLGTNNGIARFDPENGKVKNYGLNHGLQSLQFNRLSSMHLTSGEMMFGGVNGFNIFHPDSLIEKPQNIPIVFKDFQLFNKPVPIGGKGSPARRTALQAHINETSAITLAYDQSVFSIEYAGLNFPNPENIQYKYRLKGFIDENWQEAGKERKVTYTNLDPGKYVFEVTTADGITENPKRALSITVTPPWWQTWWTQLLAGFFLGASLLTIYQQRLRSIKAHNKRLEKEVKERTVSLQQANSALMEMNKLIQEQKEEIQTQAQELEESNNKIRSINHTLEEMVEIRTVDLKKSNQELDNFVYRVSHDIRAPLSSMLGLVELMKNKKNLAQLDEYLNMSAKSINKLDSFVKDILDYSRNSRMEVEYQSIDFPQLIENTLDELQYMDKAQRLHIIREIQLTSPFYNDPRRLHIIFRNLFSNAIKYQNPNIDNSFLRVKITSVKEGIGIVLEDNGIGIAAEYTDRVFDMFFRCSESSTGSGIGLYIVKETVEKLCGKIRLESRLGIGTVITMELSSFRRQN